MIRIAEKSSVVSGISRSGAYVVFYNLRSKTLEISKEELAIILQYVFDKNYISLIEYIKELYYYFIIINKYFFTCIYIVIYDSTMCKYFLISNRNEESLFLVMAKDLI